MYWNYPQKNCCVCGRKATPNVKAGELFKNSDFTIMSDIMSTDGGGSPFNPADDYIVPLKEDMYGHQRYYFAVQNGDVQGIVWQEGNRGDITTANPGRIFLKWEGGSDIELPYSDGNCLFNTANAANSCCSLKPTNLFEILPLYTTFHQQGSILCMVPLVMGKDT